MSRRVPFEAPKCPEVKKGGEEVSYTIKVVTPMYGGGAEAGVNDADNPVRAASVRGHLRFWWRATRGTAFSSIADLKKREAEIWGSMGQASSTIVEVLRQSGVESRVYPGHGFDKYGIETYAIFPASSGEHDLLKEGLTFELRLRYSEEHRDDVLCALWAWVNFGGIGARTRRGCGALYCENFAPKDSNNLASWLKGKLGEYGIETSEIPMLSSLGLPSLGRRFFYNPKEVDALGAWTKGLYAMRNFRQKPNFARNEGGERPGRSRWPEADTIRRALHGGHPSHRPNEEMPKGFPRAALGLPIVFQFKGERELNTNAYPKGKKRMASPVLLRPMGMQDGKFIAIAVFLDGTRVKELDVEKLRGSLTQEAIVNPAFA
ncbi:MAG: type III-B CRISPR module RAMP protein Cmr1, partial [Fretibacterium sp.]|nr:type III-B CRISPR module RAMP protein Cmr1 [Fretibacterium sp.]